MHAASPDLITIKEAARLAGRDLSTIYKWTWNGTLHRYGKRRPALVSRTELKAEIDPEPVQYRKGEWIPRRAV